MVNWGAANGSNFQNALAMGMQMGAQARQARERKEYRNALSNYDPSNPETIKPVMQADPRLGIQLQRDARAQQAQQQEGDLVGAALQGNEQALDQLAQVNFQKWQTLNTEQKAAVKQENEILGNAALDILNRQPQERRAAVSAYAQQFPQFQGEIGQILQLPDDQLEAALRSQVAEAKMTERLIRLEQPDYMTVGQGETLVDIRNPQAVQQFGGQQPTGTATQGQNVLQYEAFRGMIEGLGYQAAMAKMQEYARAGVAVAVNTPEEADMLPPGTPIILPDGTQGAVPQ